MSENPIVGIREKERRRRRVNRIKSAIIWTIAIWMIASITAIIYLICRCNSLDNKLDRFNEFFLSASANARVSEKKQEAPPDTSGDEQDDKDRTTSYKPKEDETTDDTKKVYLTFDDGPSDNTDDILDILKEYNVKATFFVIGKNDEHSKEMYKRIVDEGHTIALHSYSHKYSEIYKSLENYEEDLERLSDHIYDITGVRSHFLRFPGGSSNQVSNLDMKEFIKLVNDEGYTYFDWNVASGDATNQRITKEDIINNVMKDVPLHNTSVVLMHDANNKNSTVEALKDLIETLQDQGYTLLPIDENTKLVQHISVEEVINE